VAVLRKLQKNTTLKLKTMANKGQNYFNPTTAKVMIHFWVGADKDYKDYQQWHNLDANNKESFEIIVEKMLTAIYKKFSNIQKYIVYDNLKSVFKDGKLILGVKHSEYDLTKKVKNNNWTLKIGIFRPNGMNDYYFNVEDENHLSEEDLLERMFQRHLFNNKKLGNFNAIQVYNKQEKICQLTPTKLLEIQNEWNEIKGK